MKAGTAIHLVFKGKVSLLEWHGSRNLMFYFGVFTTCRAKVSTLG